MMCIRNDVLYSCGCLMNYVTKSPCDKVGTLHHIPRTTERVASPCAVHARKCTLRVEHDDKSTGAGHLEDFCG